jgi:hypothetical protein
MICADSWLARTWTMATPEILLNSISRYYMPSEHQRAFLAQAHEKASSVKFD